MQLLRSLLLTVCAPAALTASLLVSPARADEAGDAVQVVVDALRDRDVPAAEAGLDEAEKTVDLTQRTDLLHVLADRAYRHDLAGAPAPLELRRAFAARLLGLAERARTANTADARATWALADAIVVAERAGPPRGADAWREAAGLLVEAHEADPGAGEALGFAVTFLMEGACTVLDERHALTKQAEAISRSALRKHADSPQLATTLGATQTWAASTLAPVNRKASKTALKSALDCLRPLVRRDDVGIGAATVWNDAVTVGRTHGYGLRVDYATRPVEVLAGDLLLDLPLSSRWGASNAKTDNGRSYTYITHIDRADEVRAQILFRRYAFGTEYSFLGRNSVNGDNVKKIAEGVQEMSAANLFDVEHDVEQSRIVKGKIGRGMSGYTFTIEGHDRDEGSQPLTLLVRCIRGEHQASYAVIVYLHGEDREPGPELEAVLDSLRELED